MLRTYRTLATIMIAGHVGDVLTTLVFMRSGRFPDLEEGNPFLDQWINADHWLLPMVIKGGLAATILTATYLLMCSPRTYLRVAGTIALALNAVAVWTIVVHNLQMMGAL